MGSVVSTLDRGQYLDDLLSKLSAGTVTHGQAIRALRKEVTGLDQARFAKMCKISIRTLRNLESDEGNPTIGSLNSVFQPFGFQMGVVKRLRKFPYA